MFTNHVLCEEHVIMDLEYFLLWKKSYSSEASIWMSMTGRAQRVPNASFLPSLLSLCSLAEESIIDLIFMGVSSCWSRHILITENSCTFGRSGPALQPHSSSEGCGTSVTTQKSSFQGLSPAQWRSAHVIPSSQAVSSPQGLRETSLTLWWK